MKTFVIDYTPQECGYQTLIFVDLSTGKEVDRFCMPEGYFDSGVSYVDSLSKAGSFIVHKTSTKMPDIGSAVRLPNVNRKRGHRYLVDNVIVSKQNENPIKSKDGNEFTFIIYDYDIIVGDYIVKTEQKFSTTEDTFRHEMEDAGIDMTGWCLYKRRKTNFHDFVRSVFKRYDIVNIITIG